MGWYCGKDHHELIHNAGTEYGHAQVSNGKPWEVQVPGKYQCPLCKDNHIYAWQSGPVFSLRRLTSCPCSQTQDLTRSVRCSAT